MSITEKNTVKSKAPPAEKKRGGITSSIRRKITFWAGLCLSLVSLILIGYSVLVLRQTSIDNATKEATAIAEANASSVKGQLDTPLLVARTIANSLSAIKDPAIPVSLSRDEVNAMLRKILIDNPSFLGTYTLWEPNEFDGLDAKYIRAVAHDETGRFIPYWVRGDNGIIHTEALINYEMPGIGDWYILPRSTGKEVIIAPLFNRIQGQDVIIASFVIPIVQNNKFYGIAGVDAPIGFVQQLVDGINLYEGATNAVLFTETGTLVSVRGQPELTAQPASMIYPDFDEIQPQLNSTFTRISPDGKYLQIFSPISIGNGEARWVLGLIIPFEKITAPATTAAIRQVVIGSGFILLALIFLWFLAGQIVHPMQVLTDAAKAVSQGNWSVTADIHSNDEAEVLAIAFNSMTSQLENLFATLEQRVVERTTKLSATSEQNEKRARDLQTISEISRAVSNEQGLEKVLPLITNVVSERFGFYHVGIFLLDTVSNYAILSAANSPGGQKMLERGHRLEIGQIGIVGKVATTGAPRIALNVGEDAVYFKNPDLPETRSEIALPMMISGKIIGVLDVQSTEPSAFTNEDVSTLSILADQVSVAIENARLYETIRKSLEQTEASYRQYVLNEWTQFSREEKLSGFHYIDGNSAPLEVPLDLGEAAQIVSDGNIHQSEADADGRPAQLTVPIKLRDQVIGVLHVSTQQKSHWADDDIDIAEAVAEHLALAIENARLFQASANRAARERIVSDISSKISGNIRVKNILQTATQELSKALSGSDVLIQLQTPKQPAEIEE